MVGRKIEWQKKVGGINKRLAWLVIRDLEYTQEVYLLADNHKP
jgi:hypothetical protein